jgi:hypothetical protein
MDRCIYEINNGLQLVVPDNLKCEILHFYHDVPSTGHLGTYNATKDTRICELLLSNVKFCIDRQTASWYFRNIFIPSPIVFFILMYGEASSEVHVDSVAPQGTVVVPLMFLLYVYDIDDGVNSEVKLFADDCLLYRTIES